MTENIGSWVEKYPTPINKHNYLIGLKCEVEKSEMEYKNLINEEIDAQLESLNIFSVEKENGWIKIVDGTFELPSNAAKETSSLTFFIVEDEFKKIKQNCKNRNLFLPIVLSDPRPINNLFEANLGGGGNIRGNTGRVFYRQRDNKVLISCYSEEHKGSRKDYTSVAKKHTTALKLFPNSWG